MTTDFEKLVSEWDSMFLTTIDRTRDRRTEAILGTLGTGCQPPFRVLDLGSGPGPLAGRILQRFSGSRVVGVDSDPVLLRVGKKAAARYGPRARWLVADYRERDWHSGLPVGSFDAAVSSLALHWLEETEIRSLYRDLRVLLRPGGLVVNGDFLPSKKSQNTIHDPAPFSERRPRAANQVQLIQSFKRKWARWWNALEREPALHSAFVARQIRMPGTIPPRRTSGPTVPVNVESHVRALRNAGFRETAVTWRDAGFRVLVANA